MKLTLEDKIQLILLDLEETLLPERLACGFYRRGDWKPNDWSRKIMKATNEESNKGSR